MICDRWNRYVSGDQGFEDFLKDVGPRPPQKSRAERFWTIDRIEVDGNYEPENVRWATPAQQAENKRKSR